MDWGSSDEDETSSSEDDTKWENLREKFLKTTTSEEEERRKREKKERKDKEKAQRRKEREEEDEAELGGEAWQVQGKGLQAKPKMFAKDADINTSVVVKKLSEILAARGKKGEFHSLCSNIVI